MEKINVKLNKDGKVLFKATDKQLYSILVPLVVLLFIFDTWLSMILIGTVSSFTNIVSAVSFQESALLVLILKYLRFVHKYLKESIEKAREL